MDKSKRSLWCICGLYIVYTKNTFSIGYAIFQKLLFGRVIQQKIQYFAKLNEVRKGTTHSKCFFSFDLISPKMRGRVSKDTEPTKSHETCFMKPSCKFLLCLGYQNVSKDGLRKLFHETVHKTARRIENCLTVCSSWTLKKKKSAGKK